MQPDIQKQPPADVPDAAAVAPTVACMEQAVEAVLFAAGYPVAYDKLAHVIGLSESEIRSLVAHMAERYDAHGIQLLMYPDACQLCTREEFAPYIREALGVRRGGNLSASSMEVLAVIAYNQPVTRSFVDTVRGVDSAYAVSSLLDKGLIAVTGHLEAPGHPALLSTTDKFLRVFGLSSLAELPETESLSAADPGQVSEKADRTDIPADPPSPDPDASPQSQRKEVDS